MPSPSMSSDGATTYSPCSCVEPLSNHAELFRVHLPLVPPRIFPDGNLRLPFKELAKELQNLGVAGEHLEGFSALPFIDAQELAPILRIEHYFVRDVSRRLGHLFGRCRDLVMQHLDALRFCLEPGSNSYDYRHLSLLCTVVYWGVSGVDRIDSIRMD